MLAYFLLIFNSAFNTIQPHLLIKKMKQLSVNPEQKNISPGVPQGCISSPVLFTLYAQVSIHKTTL